MTDLGRLRRFGWAAGYRRSGWFRHGLVPDRKVLNQTLRTKASCVLVPQGGSAKVRWDHLNDLG
jgi:hypothetical protein